MSISRLDILRKLLKGQSKIVRASDGIDVAAKMTQASEPIEKQHISEQ
jgi:hypothetical protein